MIVSLPLLCLLWISRVDSLASLGHQRQSPTIATSQECSRREAVAGALGVAWTTSSIVTPLLTLSPEPACAYERRDVGGDDRSSEQAAYNLRAFETNSRLEREGFKLDTQEEQKASLMAELSQYTYDSPSKEAKQKNKGAESKK